MEQRELALLEYDKYRNKLATVDQSHENRAKFERKFEEKRIFYEKLTQNIKEEMAEVYQRRFIEFDSAYRSVTSFFCTFVNIFEVSYDPVRTFQGNF
jgi:hypothetical protein